ncbi:SrfA family protein [Rhodospirillum rubrum]|nr:SrfA family protein [Rhodospirillum rubrum]AEO49695.1 hypothetical protein F11_16165 [Rhodospirillum rubrum F11]QXG79893.1 hypothetical protein KUL73_16260 [Rhodospirillum rubrum]
MKQGRIILEAKGDRYRPLGVFGQPVHRAHIQLRAAIGQRLGARYADFFARPQWDEAGDTVRWVAPIPGEVRSWQDLPREEQADRALDLQIMRGEFQAYLKELQSDPDRGKGRGGGEAFSSVLEQALRTPNDGHLHFIGTQPIATFWGFTEHDGSSFDPLSAAPPPLPAAGPGAVPPPPAAPVIEERRGGRWPLWPWWLWLLPLLALLLLLLLLWWFFWRPVLPLPFGLDFGAGIEQQDKTGEPPPLTEEQRRGYLERIDSLRIDRLGRVIGPDGAVIEGVTPQDLGLIPEEGPARLDKDAAQAEPPKPSGETAPPPEAQTPPEAKTPEEKAPDPSKPDPAKPDTAPPDPKAAEPPKPEPPKPDAATPPKPDTTQAPEEPLALPESATAPGASGKADLGFLAGKWRSSSGLTDESGKPVDQTYEFDAKGQGRSVVRRADGVTCSAPAQGTMENGKLRVVEREDLRCSDGQVFERSETACERDAKGVTRCQGVYKEGGPGYEVKVKRATPAP